MDGMEKPLVENTAAVVESSNQVKPVFEHVKGFLSEDARQLLCGAELGPDPSSAQFADRQKAIRFIMVIEGQVYALSRDYFIQSSEYNDFSGGYKRKYKLLSEELVEGPLADIVLRFAAYYGILDRAIILIQVQTSAVTVDLPTQGALTRYHSITGQGIHTDGSDRAMIVCLHRGDKVHGAYNQFHANLDGTEPLCDPFILQQGEAVYFKDNELYHHVSRGFKVDTETNLESTGHQVRLGSDCARKVLLLHWPAECHLNGTTNPANDLGRTDANVKLRRLPTLDQHIH